METKTNTDYRYQPEDPRLVRERETVRVVTRLTERGIVREVEIKPEQE